MTLRLQALPDALYPTEFRGGDSTAAIAPAGSSLITIRTAEPVTVWTGREVVGAQPYVTHTYDVRLEDTATVWAFEPECVGGLALLDYFSRH